MMLRSATLDDCHGIARVQVASWRHTYRGLMPEAVLEGMTVESRRERWARILSSPRAGEGNEVLEDEAGTVRGFVSWGKNRDAAWPAEGEIYALYLDADWHGQGWGAKLFLKGLSRLRGMGWDSASVWVLQGNPSEGFYRRMGGERMGERPLEMPGTSGLTEIGYRWASLPQGPE